ncbi:unnamed protein product [Adineta ricciae]|nr:unnamed protein product [Adineta ricciae]
METDRLSSTTMEYEETSEMMVCEGSTSTKSDVQQTTEITNKSAEIISAKHHDTETNPTALVVRCYCDPFRLNTLFPHNSNLY